MYSILFIARILICAILSVCLGVFIGQWANLPTTEWDKLDELTDWQAFKKIVRWTYWSIRRFFRKMNRAYPFND